MDAKAKRGAQKKAAVYIAALMLESLKRFPKEERDIRLKQIHEIALSMHPKKYDAFPQR